MVQNNDADSPQADAPELIPPSSHAEQNPELVQPSRQRQHIDKPLAARRAIQNAITKKKREQLISDLDKAMANHNNTLEDVARTHAVTVAYLQKLINNAPTFKKKRAPNIHNAMVHTKAMEINDESSTGYRKKLSELHKIVAADQELQDMAEEEKKEIINELEAFRKLKQSGARPSNRSATTDYRGVVENLTTEFQNLSDRTGACAVAFLSRGHLDDTFEPVYICSPNAGNFVSDALKMGPSDVARLLEQWACSVARKKMPVDTLASMRIEVAASILQGLKAAAQTSKISMSYVNYDRQIVESHCVKLIGWTYKKFVSPQEISTVDDIRTLRDALRVGTCKWVRLSKHEVNQHMKNYEKQLETGEITRKLRKARSDKGTKRKRIQPEENEIKSSGSEAEKRPFKKTMIRQGKENGNVERGQDKEARGQQTKRTGADKAVRRKLKTQLPPLRSKSVISDSDSESDGLPASISSDETHVSNANTQPHHTATAPMRDLPNTGFNSFPEPSHSPACLDNDSGHPRTGASSILNNNAPFIAGDSTPHYAEHLPLSLMQNNPYADSPRRLSSYLMPETTFNRSHYGTDSTLSRGAQDVTPGRPYPASLSNLMSSVTLPTSFDPTGLSTFSNVAPSTTMTPFPSRAPFITTSSPTLPTSPACSAGLSLPPDMVQRRFSSPEMSAPFSQTLLPGSSGLSLPPDMQHPHFTTSNVYDLWPYNIHPQ